MEVSTVASFIVLIFVIFLVITFAGQLGLLKKKGERN
jgi:hypothetical protein